MKLSSREHLIIIDNSAEDKQLTNYFNQFNYDVVQQLDFSFLDKQINVPLAMLIHGSFIQNDPSIINYLYHRHSFPLIVMSDSADEDHCVRALDAGADGFLIKPIHPRELYARIFAIIRRINQPRKELENKKMLIFDDWSIYPASRQLFNRNEELFLSVGEYDLLLTFLQHPRQVLDREFLLRVIKNSDLNLFDRRIDVQISRLRQKIEVDAKKPVLIKTVRNGGYLFTAEVLSSSAE